MLSEKEIKKLIKTAKEARENALPFKSNHKIGASVLSTKGKYFGGCNIDGVISSMGTCAEMAAVNHAVVNGHNTFKAVCVIDKKIIYPCGVCLQYLTQFYQINETEPIILSADLEGNYKTYSLFELLPKGYQTNTFRDALRKYNQE